MNSNYKNPNSIAHKVLADRIGERDPGNKPKSNDRIPFMYRVIDEFEPNGFETISEKVNNGFYKNGKEKFKTIKIKGKQKFKKKKINPGDRIENPEYIRNNKIPIDYKYYITNQITNPVKQVLDLNIEYLDQTKTIFNKYLISGKKNN